MEELKIELKEVVKICFYVLNSVMILIGIYLAFLFIKSKALHTYSCYNIAIMSTTILLDNIIKIIPTEALNEYCKRAQAFFLVLFDKMIVTILSMQVIVTYIGIIKTEIYEKHQKMIFIIGLLSCLLISGILTIIFVFVPGIETNEMYSYCDTKWVPKKYIETVLSGALLCINFFCSIVVMIHYVKKKKQAESGTIEDLGYKAKWVRFLVLFFINILMIVEQFLIVYKKLKEMGLNPDIVYLVSCLIIDLGYSINDIVIKETLRIICRKNATNANDPASLIKMNTYDVPEHDDDNEDDN